MKNLKAKDKYKGVMLKEGMLVYYLVQGYVFSGKVINIEADKQSYTFSIDSYGGCGGPHVLSSTQLHHTIFLSEAEAISNKDKEQLYLDGDCS